MYLGYFFAGSHRRVDPEDTQNLAVPQRIRLFLVRLFHYVASFARPCHRFKRSSKARTLLS